MNAYGTKISKSKLGDMRFPGTDEPANGKVKPFKLSPEQLKHYLKTHELPKEIEEYLDGGENMETKKKRGRPKKMKPETAQELERMAESVNMDEELKKLEMELEEAIKENKKLEEEVDDLLDKYNKLAMQEPTLEQLRWDITSLHGQLDQLRTAKRETEECLKEEITKREALEQLVRVYV